MNHKVSAQHLVNEIHPFPQETLMRLLCPWKGIKSQKRQDVIPALTFLSLMRDRETNNFLKVKNAWLQVA